MHLHAGREGRRAQKASLSSRPRRRSLARKGAGRLAGRGHLWEDYLSMARFRLRYARRDVDLPTGQFLIGRNPGCHLVLADPRVSRTHARLLITDEAAYIEDLNSRGGVWVDGLRIKGRRRLNGGSQVTLGEQQLTVVDTLLPRPAAPAAR